MSAQAATLPRRSELAREQCWDIESIFPSQERWEAEYAALEGRLGELEQYRGRLGASAATLREGLERRDDLLAAVSRLATYASMRRAEDATNPEYGALASRASGLVARARAAAAFY